MRLFQARTAGLGTGRGEGYKPVVLTTPPSPSKVVSGVPEVMVGTLRLPNRYPMARQATTQISLSRWFAQIAVRRPLYALAPLVLIASGCAVSPPQATKPAQSDYPVMLATIDGNAGDPIKVNRYRSLLGQLDSAFVETPEQIADMSANAKAELEKEGIAESVLPIMEAMNTVLPVPVDNQKYAEYTAAYMVLRVKGQTHEQATGGLRALLAAITSNR